MVLLSLGYRQTFLYLLLCFLFLLETTMADCQRVFLVTGANSGIGFEATRQLLLASNEHKIYLLCRSESRANQAIQDLCGGDKEKEKNLVFVEFDAYNAPSNNPVTTVYQKNPSRLMGCC